MKRHFLSQLEQWKAEKSRKPLIIMGVRQCGKTYLLNTFGRNSFKRSHYLNFEENPGLGRIFEADLSPERIVTELEFTLETPIDRQNDLLIFDEIQACPKAITSLKYFSEQMPELALACAGSLLGLSLTPGSFPVGKVSLLHLHPMSFAEFLLALDEEQLLKACELAKTNHTLPITAHEKLWERFKWYLITGGLPEVVQCFVDNRHSLFNAFEQVRNKQDTLIKSYHADIAKHAGAQNALHIQRVFESIPRQLARTHNSQAPRFQFKDVIPGIQHAERLHGAIDWLKKAGLLLQTPIIRHVEMPLNAQAKENLFKLYSFDVGILNAMNDIPAKSILDYDFGSYKGYIAENFVAQMLNKNSHKLFCWQQDRAEIEFITLLSDSITPIEVKAGHVTKAKSLEKFLTLYSPPNSIILSGNPLNIEPQNTQKLPLYLSEWLPV